MKREKETTENLNKSSEAIKYFEQLMKSPRTNNDTSGLGYTSTEVGESLKSAEKICDKGKDSKPTCHYCNKKGHMTQDCRSNVTRKQRFDGHCHNCKNYGHRAFECRSKSMWTPNQHARRDNYAHH